MRFNSLIYPLFLAIVVVVLRRLPVRLRAAWLLAVSYVFYASWHWPYLLLLIGCATLNHYGAIWIAAATDRRRRGAVVVAADVALLALFKYLDWLVETGDAVARLVGLSPEWQPPRWVLPLGISFYVFESISYVVDVVRKREKPHPFWSFQLFIAFFPKLIAGPILRAKELLPQIEKPGALGGVEQTVSGLTQIVVGMFIKIVLADGLSVDVDRAFAMQPAALGMLDVWLAAVAFGLQIYFDFSGYSRIAIGSARLCGIELVDNFDHPYTARNPVDFWNRWHMSLSRWIRDYVFYPLLRRQTSRVALVRAAVLSMTLCGLWHGAGWHFLAWGFYHGLLIAGYHATRREEGTGASQALPKRAAAVLATFALVQLGWLWFRSPDVLQAATLWARAFDPRYATLRALPGTLYVQTAMLTVAVWAAPAVSAAYRRWAAPRIEQVAGVHLGWAAIDGVGLGVLAALCLLYLRGQSAFIYFQF